MSDEISVEYAIYVEDAGWVCGADGPPFYVTVGAENPSVFFDHDHAIERAQTLGNEYKRLGQPEMRDRISIFARTVTVTRAAWSDVLETAAAH